jgi:preprotein translocase subunit Sec63
MKYGNPDGASSFNVGIALPSFLVKKENHVIIMAIVFFFVVIVLPIYLIHYHSEMNKYDDFGMLA